MKKNYIAHLREYDAKTSQSSKQNNYRQKFVNTVYNQDKENINPNVPSHSHKKKTKPRAEPRQSKGHKGNSRVTTQTREEIPRQEDKSEQAIQLGSALGHNHLRKVYSSMKIDCVKLQRWIEQKRTEQSQKCLNYYSWVQQEVICQKDRALAFINSVFYKALSDIEGLTLKIDLDIKMGQVPSVDQLQLQLLTVVLDDSLRLKINDQLQQLNILRLIKGGEHTQQYLPQERCGLQCSEELIDDPTDPEYARLRRFQGNSYTDKTVRLGFPIVMEVSQEEEGISPSFKRF